MSEQIREQPLTSEDCQAVKADPPEDARLVALNSNCLNYFACLKNAGICVAAVCRYPDSE